MTRTILALLALCAAVQAATLDSLIARRRQAETYLSVKEHLESGKTEIDYAKFRDLYIASETFTKKDSETFSKRNKSAFECFDGGNFKCVVEDGNAMLLQDYTSMIAHKLLSHAYSKLGDSASSLKHQNIEIGLLKSIAKSGNGRTCRTGWKVNQVEEEYFVIRYALDMEFVSQSLYDADGICDMMVVKNNAVTDTVYFEISNVMKSYKY